MRKSAPWLCIAALATGCAAAAATDQNKALVGAIRAAKIIRSDYPLFVDAEADEATVTTLLDAKQLPDDCKIDAVLVARTVMDKDKAVMRLHYHLKDHMVDSSYLEILVKESDVKAYGANAIDDKTLLKLLDIVQVKGSSATKTTAAVQTAVPAPDSDSSSKPESAAVTTRFGPIAELPLLKPDDQRTELNSNIVIFARTIEKLAEKNLDVRLLDGLLTTSIKLAQAGDIAEFHKVGSRITSHANGQLADRDPADKSYSADKYAHIAQTFQAKVDRALGPDAQQFGAWYSERTRIMLAIRELESHGVNCNGLRKKVSRLNEMAPDDRPLRMYLPIKEVADQLAAMRPPPSRVKSR
ncbi:MAG: hypothetical protein ACRD3W_31480 [Terriglobales bacterium]